MSYTPFSAHASERIADIDRELSGDEREVLNTNIAKVRAKVYTRDTAVRVLRINRHLGETGADYYQRKFQNGNNIFLIIRRDSGGSFVATIMRRRDNQPMTPAALDVDQVVILK